MTFWQKSSEKCDLLGLSAVSIVLLPVLLERGILVQTRNTFQAHIYAK